MAGRTTQTSCARQHGQRATSRPVSAKKRSCQEREARRGAEVPSRRERERAACGWHRARCGGSCEFGEADAVSVAAEVLQHVPAATEGGRQDSLAIVRISTTLKSFARSRLSASLGATCRPRIGAQVELAAPARASPTSSTVVPTRSTGTSIVCLDCGYERPAYNSCRNRQCPKCQALAQEKWIEESWIHRISTGAD